MLRCIGITALGSSLRNSTKAVPTKIQRPSLYDGRKAEFLKCKYDLYRATCILMH